MVLLLKGGKTIATGERVGHLEALSAERVDQGIGDGRFIFDKQDAWHGCISIPPGEMPMKKP